MLFKGSPYLRRKFSLIDLGVLNFMDKRIHSGDGAVICGVQPTMAMLDAIFSINVFTAEKMPSRLMPLFRLSCWIISEITDWGKILIAANGNATTRGIFLLICKCIYTDKHNFAIYFISNDSVSVRPPPCAPWPAQRANSHLPYVLRKTQPAVAYLLWILIPMSVRQKPFSSDRLPDKKGIINHAWL